MNLRSKLCFVLLVTAVIALPFARSLRAAAGKTGAAQAHLRNAQTGGLKLESISTLQFGPDGLLLVGEPRTASIVAIATGDTGPVRKLKQRVDDVGGLVEKALGAQPGGARIVDLAVNPASGTIYLAVTRQPGNQPVLLTVDADGRLAEAALDKAPWVRVPLADNPKTRIGNITDVAFAGDRVLAAGASSEEFASKIFSLPLPLEHGRAGAVFSAETYHVSHRKWETRAPISSFIPYEEGGKQYVVGAFACTPIAKFPLNDLGAGATVKGTSVFELGSGNRPLDLFTYKKDGHQWLVVHTQRFHTNLFGPSKFWGARIDMKYLGAHSEEDTNEKAARRNVKARSGPEGVDVVEPLFGAVQVDKLGDDEVVVLRENGTRLMLELARLP